VSFTAICRVCSQKLKILWLRVRFIEYFEYRTHIKTRAGQCVFLSLCAEFAEWCAATEGNCCTFRAPFPFPQSTAGTTSLQRLVDADGADEQRQAAAEQQVETAEQQQQQVEVEAPAEAATGARAAPDAVEAATAPQGSNRVAAAATTRGSKRSKK
jgi:hypothetical protein